MAARCEITAGAAIFCVANNQHDRIFWAVLRIRYDYQRRTKEDRDEEASVHQVTVQLPAAIKRAYTTSTLILETLCFFKLDRTSASSCIGSTPLGI